MRICVLLFAVVILSVCDRPPSGEADHSKHDHTQINHGVVDDSKMESSPGASEAPQTLQFIDTMIAHHQATIDIALLANTRTQRDEVRKLAVTITKELRSETADLKAWRAKWFGDEKPAVNTEFPGMKTSIAGMDTVKLAGLKYNEFDVEFIRQMIELHEGAIEMAKSLKTDDKYVELSDLANSIVTSRSTEIERMKGWQATWSATAK
jgi:uncharacterized protein (DUF305 family)